MLSRELHSGKDEHGKEQRERVSDALCSLGLDPNVAQTYDDPAVFVQIPVSTLLRLYGEEGDPAESALICGTERDHC